jgi:hypothetical protein
MELCLLEETVKYKSPVNQEMLKWVALQNLGLEYRSEMPQCPGCGRPRDRERRPDETDLCVVCLGLGGDELLLRARARKAR